MFCWKRLRYDPPTPEESIQEEDDDELGTLGHVQYSREKMTVTMAHCFMQATMHTGLLIIMLQLDGPMFRVL